MKHIDVPIDRITATSGGKLAYHDRVAIKGGVFHLTKQMEEWFEAQEMDYSFVDKAESPWWHVRVSHEDAVLVMLKFPVRDYDE